MPFVSGSTQFIDLLSKWIFEFIFNAQEVMIEYVNKIWTWSAFK
jgi:hypothetical protein